MCNQRLLPFTTWTHHGARVTLNRETDEYSAKATRTRKWRSMVESVIPTASEYERYNTTKGQTQYRLVQTFVGSTQYKKLTDEERAEVLKDIYSYATSAANQELAQKRGYESNMESWMKNAKDGAGVLQSAVFRATMGEDKSKTNAIRTAGSLGYQRSTVDKLLKVQLSNSDYALYSALANVGMNANAIADFFIEADTNSNGSFTQDEMRAMLSNYRRNDATSIWNAYAAARNWKSGY